MNFFKVCGVIVAWVLVATAAHAESISGMRGGPAYRDGIRNAQLRGYGYNDAISPVVRGFGGPVWSTVNENDVLPRDGNTLREVKSEAYVQISRKGVESDANGSVSGEPAETSSADATNCEPLQSSGDRCMQAAQTALAMLECASVHLPYCLLRSDSCTQNRQ